MSTVKRFATVDRHGFAVQFSPFHGGRVLCGASANYGIAGGGRLYVLTVPSRPSAPVAVERV